MASEPLPTEGAGSSSDDDELNKARMSLVEHLKELRSRVVKALIAFGIAFVAAWIAYQPVLDFLLRPYRKVVDNPNQPLYTIGLLEGFATRVKVTAFVALAAALPVILWQFWRFIAPGLRRREKRYGIGFVVCSVILFAAGSCVAYVTAVPAFDLLLHIGGESLEPIITADKYISFFILMCVAFGAAFEFPILLIFLVLIEAVDSRTLLRGWRIAVLFVTLVAAVITPSQDPITMMALAGPMIGLYFGAIGFARFVLKR